MCDPATIALSALSIASAGAGLMGTQAAADEENARIDQANAIKAENTKRAHLAANQQHAQAQAALQQEVQSELDAGFEDALIGRARAASAINAAGAAGIDGLSVFEVVDDLNFAATRQSLNTQQSIENAQTQFGFQAQDIENKRFANIQSNRASMNVSGVGAADVAGAALEVAGTATKRGIKKGFFGTDDVSLVA
tara:strand:+ start:2071 stop:2655 length:585 start_codon:yes stop_codon:yes gene_type:complete